MIAFAGGGALYTVKDGVTGQLFSEPTAGTLERILADFDPGAYDSRAIREHARQWDAAVFRDRLVEQVHGAVGQARTPA